MSRLEEPTTEKGADSRTNDGSIKSDGLPPKLSLLRHKLGEKAKREPKFRFYTLYSHIASADTLRAAYERVRSNKGAPGLDGVSFEDIERREGGVEALIEGLLKELRAKKYKPKPVLRVYIPKPGTDKMRPLGIPGIPDRVVQMATLLILEPIFEADFMDCSYGFRPGRSQHQALEEMRTHMKNGYCAVYDVDLKGYFDSIPHDKLMKCLEKRIADRYVLKLIRMWLQAPVVDPKGRRGRKPKASRPKKGTPQGGVISPMRSNLYLHWFDRAFHANGGLAVTAKAKLVRYADDFVVMARCVGNHITGFVESKIEKWMGLEINREKTRIVNVRKEGESLDFLGFTFRYDRDLQGRPWKYLNIFPSRKAVQKEKEKLREITSPRNCSKPIPCLIQEINHQLNGWANYFKYGYPRKVFRDMNNFTRKRLKEHLNRRSQRKYRPPKGSSHYQHFKKLGLVYL